VEERHQVTQQRIRSLSSRIDRIEQRSIPSRASQDLARGPALEIVRELKTYPQYKSLLAEAKHWPVVLLLARTPCSRCDDLKERFRTIAKKHSSHAYFRRVELQRDKGLTAALHTAVQEAYPPSPGPSPKSVKSSATPRAPTTPRAAAPAPAPSRGRPKCDAKVLIFVRGRIVDRVGWPQQDFGQCPSQHNLEKLECTNRDVRCWTCARNVLHAPPPPSARLAALCAKSATDPAPPLPSVSAIGCLICNYWCCMGCMVLASVLRVIEATAVSTRPTSRASPTTCVSGACTTRPNTVLSAVSAGTQDLAREQAASPLSQAAGSEPSRRPAAYWLAEVGGAVAAVKKAIKFQQAGADPIPKLEGYMQRSFLPGSPLELCLSELSPGSICWEGEMLSPNTDLQQLLQVLHFLKQQLLHEDDEDVSYREKANWPAYSSRRFSLNFEESRAAEKRRAHLRETAEDRYQTMEGFLSSRRQGQSRFQQPSPDATFEGELLDLMVKCPLSVKEEAIDVLRGRMKAYGEDAGEFAPHSEEGKRISRVDEAKIQALKNHVSPKVQEALKKFRRNLVKRRVALNLREKLENEWALPNVMAEVKAERKLRRRQQQRSPSESPGK